MDAARGRYGEITSSARVSSRGASGSVGARSKGRGRSGRDLTAICLRLRVGERAAGDEALEMIGLCGLSLAGTEMVRVGTFRVCFRILGKTAYRSTTGQQWEERRERGYQRRGKDDDGVEWGHVGVILYWSAE